MLVTTVSCPITTEATEMLIGVGTCGGSGYHVLDGGVDHAKGRGNFGGGVSRRAVYNNL